MALKVRRTFAVKIRVGDEEATFHFRKADANEVLKFAVQLRDAEEEGKGGATTKDLFDQVFAKLERIDGLVDEDGVTLDVEDLKGYSLPFDLMWAIAQEYGAGVNIQNNEYLQKKEKSTSEEKESSPD